MRVQEATQIERVLPAGIVHGEIRRLRYSHRKHHVARFAVYFGEQGRLF